MSGKREKINVLNEFIKNFYLDRLIKEKVIYKKNGKYYSNCRFDEEITLELKEIFGGD